MFTLVTNKWISANYLEANRIKLSFSTTQRKLTNLIYEGLSIKKAQLCLLFCI